MVEIVKLELLGNAVGAKAEDMDNYFEEEYILKNHPANSEFIYCFERNNGWTGKMFIVKDTYAFCNKEIVSDFLEMSNRKTHKVYAHHNGYKLEVIEADLAKRILECNMNAIHYNVSQNFNTKVSAFYQQTTLKEMIDDYSKRVGMLLIDATRLCHSKFVHGGKLSLIYEDEKDGMFKEYPNILDFLSKWYKYFKIKVKFESGYDIPCENCYGQKINCPACKGSGVERKDWDLHVNEKFFSNTIEATNNQAYIKSVETFFEKEIFTGSCHSKKLQGYQKTYADKIPVLTRYAEALFAFHNALIRPFDSNAGILGFINSGRWDDYKDTLDEIFDMDLNKYPFMSTDGADIFGELKTVIGTNRYDLPDDRVEYDLDGIDDTYLSDVCIKYQKIGSHLAKEYVDFCSDVAIQKMGG